MRLIDSGSVISFSPQSVIRSLSAGKVWEFFGLVFLGTGNGLACEEEEDGEFVIEAVSGIHASRNSPLSCFMQGFMSGIIHIWRPRWDGEGSTQKDKRGNSLGGLRHLSIWFLSAISFTILVWYFLSVVEELASITANITASQPQIQRLYPYGLQTASEAESLRIWIG